MVTPTVAVGGVAVYTLCGVAPTREVTFRFQGRDHRLTDVHGVVVKPILA